MLSTARRRDRRRRRDLACAKLSVVTVHLGGVRAPVARPARVVLAVALVALGLPLGARTALAAETTGTLVGAVRVASGAAVAHAAVVAAAPSGRYRTESDASGRFAIVAVVPDTYAISVDAPGYRAELERGVTVYPGATVRVDVTLSPQISEIGRVRAQSSNAFAVGTPQDAFTVSGAAARAPARASSSGLAAYTAGSVQGAIAAVPGVQQDQFANAILRGGKVQDVAFSFDAVPVPQAIIAEPGGNVIGAQLPVTGVGYTTVTTAGFAANGDDALGGIVDEVPRTGVYPAQTTFSTGFGLLGAARDVELERLWATPSLHQRYAVDATIGSRAIRYGDGTTFYPAEAATYGLALDSRATWSLAANGHLAVGRRDDLELLALAGEATFDQYGTPFPGQTYGAFDGATTVFPGEPSPLAHVKTPTRIRGTYAIEKIQLLRAYDRSYARVRLYQSRYGSQTSAPFFDDLSFPNGVVSYAGRQSGILTGFGFDVQSLAGERHRIAYGVELRRQTSSLDQVVPTLDQRLASDPVLSSGLGYVSDAWSPAPAFTLEGALRANATHVARSDRRSYGVSSLDPHVSGVFHLHGGGALRLAYDHTTVAPKPLEAERIDPAQPDAPFVPLAAERGDSYELSFERATPRGRVRFTVFSKDERNRIDVAPVDFRTGGNALGVPQNVGALLANGAEAALERGPFSFSATYVRARSSSASQFGLNDLNAPALAANHLFPVGYVPDFSAIASYRARIGKVTVAPAISYESGYPYGNGRTVWVYGANGVPVRVQNDNHVNPGFSYYFLRDPGLPYDAAANPVIGSLGTPEGDDPNTMRSTPMVLVSLHADVPVTPRVSVSLDVTNLFGTARPTQLQGNPYLIGPPGYTGGDPLYAAWYGQHFNGMSYTLGNGVPTNDGTTRAVPWTYGTAGYVPSSYPEARSVYLRLQVRV
jgi:TonB dependent receptor/Carboxypeptidase regulatory-like domain